MSRTMQESGIDCIGAIPKEWALLPLRRLCNSITDGSHFSPERQLEGRHYITVSDVYSDTVHFEDSMRISQEDFDLLVNNGCKPNVGDVLLSKDGSVGRTAVVKANDYVVLSSLAILSPNKERVNNQFLKRLLDSEGLQEQMRITMAGSAIKRITLTKINSFIAVLPPLCEQQAIADFLDKKCCEIDEMISLQEKIIEELKAYKQSVITEAVCQGLKPDTSMKDSGIEWIERLPITWDVCKVKNVLNLLTDYDANGSFADIAENVKVNEGEPYAWLVRATDLENKRYGIVEGNNYCDKDTFDYLKKSVVHSGDVLIAKRGEIGKVYIVPAVDCKMTLAPNTYLLIINKKVISRFLYYSLSSELGKKQLVMNNKSTAIGAIYKDDVKNMFMFLPPLQEQQAIADFLDEKCNEIDTLISIKQSKIDALKEYKKSIIYEYITGKRETPSVSIEE